MLLKLRRSIVLVWKVITFFLLASVFFLLFSRRNPFLLTPSRTAGITMLAYALVYLLMTRVYGGFDIGKKKSRPIIYSLSLCVVTADLAAHLFLCIMNVTVVHQGHFVYEQPYLLLLSIVLQVILISALAYAGNAFYFRLVKPQRCLVIAHTGDDVRRLTASRRSSPAAAATSSTASTDTTASLSAISPSRSGRRSWNTVIPRKRISITRWRWPTLSRSAPSA